MSKGSHRSSVIGHRLFAPKGRLDQRKVRAWLIGGVVVLLAAGLASQLYVPFVLDLKESRETAKLREQLEATRRENSQLERRLEDVETPRGLEMEARANGMVREGEIPIRAPAAGPESPAPEGEPWRSEGPTPLAVRISRLGAETAAWFEGVIGQLIGRPPGE